MSTGRLTGQVRQPPELTSTERAEMYTLLADYFVNVTRPHFETDLAEKEWVILLTDTATGQVQGFSTLMRLQITMDNQPIVAFFSGDTIIHRDYWSEMELPRLWGKHVFNLAETIGNEARVYWFLISSGYKTYRFLPVFFREFYPTYLRPTPPGIKRILDALACLKFPSEYDAGRGIIRFAQAAPLRPGVAEITERRLKDPHVAFLSLPTPAMPRATNSPAWWN
ncbi:MAG: hypothetical protein HC875_26475 [Anaerolineales bacterium]|nr:hypothetical protein [Anaerolineales bacterium]